MKNAIKNFAFIVRNRFILFSIFLFLFMIVQYVVYGEILPTADSKDMWFYYGVAMILFSMLFIEPYYSSPKNVITNAVPLVLVFFSIKSIFENSFYWWFAVSILLGLILVSIIAMTLEDKESSPDYWKNQVSSRIKNFIVLIGQGKILYSSTFVYFLLTYHSIQNFYTVIIFILWAIILCINPKLLHNNFSFTSKKQGETQIGDIISVQSGRIFLVKLYEDKINIKKFDIVKFNYSIQMNKTMYRIGIIFDTYLLDQEKWIKVLQLDETESDGIDCLKTNGVYKIEDSKQEKNIVDALKIDHFVGIVIEGSSIGKIKFEYSKKNDDLQEGDLLELRVGEKRLFYQVVGGYTESERIEGRNEIGIIEGVATQLGEWHPDKFSFQKFGWVPPINTPIFKADTSNVKVKEFDYPCYKIGVVPGTSLPSVVDLNEAVSHHIALLGITGSGKSFLAREIIQQLCKDTKIICVDFNREFVTTLNPVPLSIISKENESIISDKINLVANELEKFPNQQDKRKIESEQNEIKKLIKDEIKNFLDDHDCKIKVFELADLANTVAIFDYTKYFFKLLFEIAKENQITGKPIKICVVLEEAHTVIPEWNFSGTNDKASQSLVNSIGQIALQGRKYDIGFMVIAQRTASVSKTILTQCNTVICFQAFDETSFSFLGNYVGKDMVQALPNLKQFHAIVAGKAVKSNMPMIVDLTRNHS